MPLAPAVRAIWEDAEGLLWLVTTVPTGNPDVAMDTLRSEGRSIPVPKNFDDAWDTVVDVVDLRAGQLVASARFPEYLQVAVGPDGMMHVEETDAGLRMTIVRFKLRRP
jgi:hypothetical protein